VGSKAVGVILTGMGSDGVDGLERLRAAGAHTIAQDESTSTVYGMPKAAVDRGVIDQVLPLGSIAGAVHQLLVAPAAPAARRPRLGNVAK